RSAPSCSPARARRRRASTGASVTRRLYCTWQDRSMRIAAVQTHDGRKLAVDVDGEHRRLEFDRDLLSLIQRGVDPQALSVGAALDYVFGYTVCNDVSARDVQFSESQWTRGKSFDTFCPLGPVVVTADEITDPQALALGTRVNGEVMQDSSTGEMLFGVAEL